MYCLYSWSFFFETYFRKQKFRSRNIQDSWMSQCFMTLIIIVCLCLANFRKDQLIYLPNDSMI